MRYIMPPETSEYSHYINAMVGAEGGCHLISDAKDPYPLWMLVFDRVPGPASVTAFTSGISSVIHPAWKYGRPEMVLSIDSVDPAWWSALGLTAKRLRGICPFSYGNTLRCGRPISGQSEMSAFFLFWPTILQKDEWHLTMSTGIINLVQAYPIFTEESGMISRIGAENFFMQDDVDFSNPARKNSALRQAEYK